ncbi:MAG: hypothetical protein AB1705_16220 [Verrucomicrobiota bacterium]
MRANERECILLRVNDAPYDKVTQGSGNTVIARAMDKIVLLRLTEGRNHRFVHIVLGRRQTAETIGFEHHVTEKVRRCRWLTTRAFEKTQPMDCRALKIRIPFQQGGVLLRQESAIRFSNFLYQEGTVPVLASGGKNPAQDGIGAIVLVNKEKV